MLSFHCLRTPILTDVQKHLIMILICIFLINVVEYFLCIKFTFNITFNVVTIFKSSFDKCLFKSFAHFKIGLFSSSWVLRIFWISALYQIITGKCFLLFCGWSLCFAMQKFSVRCNFVYLLLFLLPVPWDSYSEKSLFRPISWRFSLVVLEFQVLHLSF